ncbi:MAG: 3-deoxy-manno-octulosonate cytidylyltransferase [Phycisphaerales bacterium]|nr:MAG: 3-deoxy-manno-octulosonate cytidylyltransferase [Phycisphaerales bacterium]
MPVVAIIPARYASTRFPGKPLASETGKPLIQHVYDRVTAARLVDRVIVATDDERILRAVRGFGGHAEMTRGDHATGTDRIAEVAAELGEEFDTVLNVQGDEPELEPGSVDRLVEVIREHRDCSVATLACRFRQRKDAESPNNVKVVLDGQGRALYFSRSLVPYARDAEQLSAEACPWLLHVGIYAYRRNFLLKLANMAATPLERLEKLEQLRVLENGYAIAVGLVDRAAIGVDTPEDYAAFVERYKRSAKC